MPSFNSVGADESGDGDGGRVCVHVCENWEYFLSIPY